MRSAALRAPLSDEPRQFIHRRRHAVSQAFRQPGGTEGGAERDFGLGRVVAFNQRELHPGAVSNGLGACQEGGGSFGVPGSESDASPVPTSTGPHVIDYARHDLADGHRYDAILDMGGNRLLSASAATSPLGGGSSSSAERPTGGGLAAPAANAGRTSRLRL